MTTLQRVAISNPANGLIVYDTDVKSLEVYDAVGEVWNGFGAAAGIVSVAQRRHGRDHAHRLPAGLGHECSHGVLHDSRQRRSPATSAATPPT